MKLRIEKNSIRLRLRPSDVATFAAQGVVEESLNLGGGAVFAYRLKSSREAGSLCAAFVNCGLEIEVPHSVARNWAEGTEVAISGQQDTGGEPLAILIEKDFKCMHKDDAANADAYPNPLAD